LRAIQAGIDLFFSRNIEFAKMTSLTIRVRSESGMKRLECESDTPLGVLKAQIASVLNVFPDDQILSRDGTDATAWRGDATDQKSLSELGIKHGDMLFLKSKSKSASAASSSGVATTTAASTRSSRCTHGDNAKCLNCQNITNNANNNAVAKDSAADVSTASTSATAQQKIDWLCSHRPGDKCINCIAPIVAATPPPANGALSADGTCRHPPSMTCPHCPDPSKKKKGKNKKTGHKPLPCEHGPNGMCPRCLPPSTDRELDDVDGPCARHGPHGSCVACIERRQARKFAMKRQTQDDTAARHVLLASAPAQAFATSSLRAFEAKVQRGALLFGWYKKSGSVVIEAFYEPPQRAASESFVFLRDDPAAPAKKAAGSHQLSYDERNANAERIAELLGWRCVGWALTASEAQQAKLSASGLSAAEVARAVALQAHYAQKYAVDGVVDDSPAFITLVVKEHVTANGQRTGAMEAFQLSQQAATLHRRNAIAPTQTDLHALTLTEEVLVEAAETKSVPIEFFLVPTAVKAHNGAFIAHFPSFAPPTPAGAPAMSDLKAQLMQLSDLKFVRRIKDFNLLVFLSAYLDMKSDMPTLCQAVLAEDEESTEGFKFIISSFAGLDQ
jgi:nuclear protein localization family protein 4